MLKRLGADEQTARGLPMTLGDFQIDEDKVRAIPESWTMDPDCDYDCHMAFQQEPTPPTKFYVLGHDGSEMSAQFCFQFTRG